MPFSILSVLDMCFEEADSGCVVFTAAGNFLGSLGVVCKCCDGETEGECKTKWDTPCQNLQCLPWKYH